MSSNAVTTYRAAASGEESRMATSKATKSHFPGFVASSPSAQHCLTVLIRGGEFRSANFVVPISDGGLKISGGVENGTFVAPSDGSHGIYGKSLAVPGGVTGLGAVSRALGSMGNVTAQVQAVKPMLLNDLLAFDLTLFLRIHVQNPLVGGECYIGTPSEPLTVRMQRIEGDDHIPKLTRDGIPSGVIAIGNINVAASNFKVPAVTGAGPRGAFNTVVNVRASLPNSGVSTSLSIRADAYLAQNPDYNGD
ncbi:hypothetical protein [Hoyosella altamirensis]|uniref:Uncharacterized protein n=2 Tax=Hoyosella altamirensis TaxID=616997 RepID=A0A839RHQ3_9ACTN|nr:hypothetical protein [Hoyosella altamirensis]MBB3035768.1 hypothetical protein [Hoyosella altamirensis]